ncbi:tRNA (N(6)-L-threonylcarbamoyladenosine(37)-C(2))-methylthiotransferase MtaB [Candidatus Haliotispira prima]|uniref:tRNA (N(6)-L-threonylcarbamoyladenosine(37)-C(2))-methylthiotransferase MtaB n=1 Tax=Candidatus Haliotispira prima TaxID=3034016 RepID=A0ABY8MFT8_9SPIO|nr:tRNA (N(6)-L-threonylcarbamoyladenosine(37)-C(2))-methylthiotransferase MtaB [Candidatus Haliotispira prima]
MLRISSYTFGCKLNQSETESALGILADSGYEIVPWESGADLYLINTCTVTGKGEQKARRLIRQVQLLWPQSVVLAAGCYAVLEREKLEALGERVCALSDQPAQICRLLADKPLANSDELLQLLRNGIAEHLAAGGRRLEAGVVRPTDFPEALLRPTLLHSATQRQDRPARPAEPGPGLDSGPRPGLKLGPPVTTKQAGQPGFPVSPPTPLSVSRGKTRRRYFFKIQDGCNRTCSFCRIRIARGPSRSLSLPLLVQQLQDLEARGYAEAVITGVHINSYHYRDETAKRDYYLGGLLCELIAHTEHIRLRLSSLEPEAPESEHGGQLIRALASQRICPHFHISVQSGSEHVLRQMRRGYTAARQRLYIEHLKALRPNAFLSCDVIVGFPGEREEDFEATCQLLKEKEFAAIHAFSYSPRPGTDAFTMPKVRDSIVKQRMQHIQLLATTLQHSYLQNCLGREVKVLLEERKDGYWLGYSENYVRTRISDANSVRQGGEMVSVRLQSCSDSQEDNPEDNQGQESDFAQQDTMLEGIPLVPTVPVQV